MIEKAYVDTCILAAYYCSEQISEDAERLLLSIKEPIISSLTEVELFSVISKKVRKRELKKRDAEKIIENFTVHLKEGYYRQIHLKPEHYLKARNFLESLSYSLHSLDSLHLSIASSESFSLVTADENLAKTAKKLKIQTYLPR